MGSSLEYQRWLFLRSFKIKSKAGKACIAFFKVFAILFLILFVFYTLLQFVTNLIHTYFWGFAIQKLQPPEICTLFPTLVLIEFDWFWMVLIGCRWSVPGSKFKLTDWKVQKSGKPENQRCFHTKQHSEQDSSLKRLHSPPLRWNLYSSLCWLWLCSCWCISSKNGISSGSRD